MRPAKPTDIHNAPQNGGGAHGGIDGAARDLVNHQLHPAPFGQRQHLICPIRIIGIHRVIRTEFLQTRAPFGIGGSANHQPRPHVFRNLHAHQPNATGSTQNQHRFALRQTPIGNQRIMHGGKRHRQGRCLFPGHVTVRHRLHAAHIGNGIFRIAA